MPGDAARALLREPLKIAIDAQRVGSELRVTVKLTNAGAGHSIPTGSPARQLLMLVEAETGGAPLAAIGGYTVPAWGGALVEGTLGSGASALVGNSVTLPSGQQWPTAAVGMPVRFVQLTGSYEDYPATRWFGDTARSAQQKGVEIAKPLGQATITTINGGVATLDGSPSHPAGTRFFVGDTPATAALEADDTIELRPLAGAPGYAFAKVMVDENGKRVPFFRAVDIAADNRIPSGKTATTQHVFDASAASGNATVSVTLLYRSHPWAQTRQRGWSVNDAVRARQVEQVSLGN